MQDMPYEELYHKSDSILVRSDFHLGFRNTVTDSSDQGHLWPVLIETHSWNAFFM